jgi:hypothetical protein
MATVICSFRCVDFDRNWCIFGRCLGSILFSWDQPTLNANAEEGGGSTVRQFIEQFTQHTLRREATFVIHQVNPREAAYRLGCPVSLY